MTEENQDVALVDAEGHLYGDPLTQIQGMVGGEASARASADSALGTRISNEGFARPREATGADMNSFTTQGFYSYGTGTLNSPNGKLGTAVVGNVSGYVTQLAIITRSAELWYRNRPGNTAAWTAWEQVATSADKGPLPAGSDVRLLAVGNYSVASLVVFNSLLNAPTDPAAAGAGLLEVFRLGASYRAIRWTTTPSNGTPPRVFFTYQLYSGWLTWFELGAQQQTTPPPAGDALVADTSNAVTTKQTGNAGLRNALLREAFYRKYRTYTDLPVVSFRFDDGHNYFKDMVLPIVREHAFPYSLAVCSRRWDHVENNQVTPEEMNGWILNDKAEIWNHTATHRDPNGAVDEIVNGLTELREQLPAAEIWGWYAPGIENGFDGFLPTRGPEQLSATLGGQLALANHACVSGYIPGAALRPLDGTTIAGFAHYSLDGRDLATAKTALDSTVTKKGRQNFMLHPSRLDKGNGMSLADFTAFMAYVAELQEQGKLRVLSPYHMEAATTIPGMTI